MRNGKPMTTLPEKIIAKINGQKYTRDAEGKSDAAVLLFEKMVLKIEKISRSSKHEIKLLNWLDGKLPVPKIIEAEQQDGYSYLLMTKLSGDMVCTGESLKNMEASVTAMASGLKKMWQLDITSCPCVNTVQEKLIQAKYQIENNLVDTDNFDPDTLGPESPEGFSCIPDLYNFLEKNQPPEDLVFSHGDYTFQNILVSGSDITGLIDLGNGGTADRWQDISLCYRALRKRHSKYNLYTEKEYQKYKALFFQELGMETNEKKARYYNLLDEFF
jgi:kanamycin kinase/aminoglycoside 3'-phosphotransferase-3